MGPVRVLLTPRSWLVSEREQWLIPQASVSGSKDGLPAQWQWTQNHPQGPPPLSSRVNTDRKSALRTVRSLLSTFRGREERKSSDQRWLTWNRDQAQKPRDRQGVRVPHPCPDTG